jgi:FkbM family methyltransferase
LFEEVITEPHGAVSVSSHEVELITIDNFLCAKNINEIDLLKIDVEGNVLEVLKKKKRGGGDKFATR